SLRSLDMGIIKCEKPSFRGYIMWKVLSIIYSQSDCFVMEDLKSPTDKHLSASNRIFRYLRGTINMGLWYLKDSGFALTAFADADYAGCQDTRR
nr:uncharacterized mitochondrial protein AtMg00810-like [Tanacetum cinerariifolium]